LGTAAGMGSSAPSSFGGTGTGTGTGPFMGMGLTHTGASVIENNEQTTYETWEFLYDPRVEAMKAKTSLLGGAPAAASGLGGTNGIGGTTPGIGGAPGIGGTTPGTGGGAGTGTGTGAGTGGGGSTGGAGTQPPQ
jgi:hypothetical protein